MTYTVQDILSSIPWATDSTLLPYYWSSDNNTWIVMLPTLATSATPSYSVKTLSGSTESTVSVSSSLHYDHGRVAVPINFENLIDSNYLRLKIKNNQTESPLYIELSPAAYTYTNEEQFSSGVGEPAVQGDGTWTPNSGKTVFLHSNKMAMMVTPSGASTNYWKAQGGVLAEGKLLKDTDSGVTYSTRLHVQCANVTGLSYTVGVADGDLIVAGEAFHGGRNIATVIKANEAHSSDRYDVKLGVMFYKLSSTSVRIRAVVWLDGKRVYTSEDPYTISSSHIHTAGSSPNLNNLAYISVSVLANANQTVLADGDYKWSTMATSDAILD